MAFFADRSSQFMKTISKRICTLLAAMLLHQVAGCAQAVSAMKLLTSTTGWVQSDLDHLYWTTDQGSHWKEITPPKSPKEFLTGIFFLDSSSGWAVLAHEDDPGTGAISDCFNP